jgi:hypothetical protein
VKQRCCDLTELPRWHFQTEWGEDSSRAQFREPAQPMADYTDRGARTSEELPSTAHDVAIGHHGFIASVCEVLDYK